METLKRLIPLICATVVLLGVYWWQGQREKTPPEVPGTSESGTSKPTGQPITVPTTKPTTAPTTQPTTAPTTPPATTPPTTAPTEPVLTADQCLLEPEYPSYEELFSEDISYQVFAYDWMVAEGDIYRLCELDFFGGDVRISDSSYELEYVVPNTKDFRKDYGSPQLIGSDGKYAWFFNSDEYSKAGLNRILRLDLRTGAVEVLLEEERIYGWPSLRGNCVVYYTRAAEAGGEICRLYLPENRVDVLYKVDNPEFIFEFTYPGSTLGSVGWYGINPQILDRAIAEWENPESAYKKWAVDGKTNPNAQTYDFTDLWDWWNQETRPRSGYSRDGLEFFFHFFQKDTGIWGLEQTQVDIASGKITRKEGTLDNCWLGTGYSHEHFNPVTDPLPVPVALMGEWKAAPGWDFQGVCEEIETGDYPYAATLRVPGQDHKQVFWIDRGIATIVKDAPWKVISYSSKSIYCVTEENTLIELSVDGSICNTLYKGQEALGNFEHNDGMLCFKEGDRVILLDIEKGQYRVLMDNSEVYIELWFQGEDWVLISLTRGLYYQQYRFYIETGLLEETHII